MPEGGFIVDSLSSSNTYAIEGVRFPLNIKGSRSDFPSDTGFGSMGKLSSDSGIEEYDEPLRFWRSNLRLFQALLRRRMYITNRKIKAANAMVEKITAAAMELFLKLQCGIRDLRGLVGDGVVMVMFEGVLDIIVL